MVVEKAPIRVGDRPPGLTAENRPFWTGGGGGALLIQRCFDCQRFIHPPEAACPDCSGGNVGPVPVSGEATVATYTVNYQRWSVADIVPTIFAIVELIEQPQLWVMTRVVNCEAQCIHIGARVVVTFEALEDVWLPLFEPWR